MHAAWAALPAARTAPRTPGSRTCVATQPVVRYICLMAQLASAIINLFLEICVLQVRTCSAFSGLHACA